MHVVLVADVLLVHHVGVDALAVVLPPQDRVEVLLEVSAVAVEEAARIVSEQKKLSLVRLRVHVALKPIGVPTLLLTHLTVPSKLLQTFRSHLVRYPLWGSKFSSALLPHN